MTDAAPLSLRRSTCLIAPAVLAALVLAMFVDVLVSPSRVLSHPSTDLALQFLPWRQFGFEQMRAGNLPLWNPHIFGGTPYFAGFQSAMLYPPNWLHLILPLNVAINWIIALHVFAAGYFTYLWCRWRLVSVGGSILAGAMFMFAGPYVLHVYAGHLPHVAVMVWTPLVLLAIDGLSATGAWRWVALAIVALTLQIFAGHPQYVYYTGIALSVYVALQLIRSPRRARLAGGFVAMYGGALVLSAVQVLPGWGATRESVRASGTEFAFASLFSLPPRNFVTLIAPNFFGRLPLAEGQPPIDAYWGAGYLWEMSLFVSITGLALAIYGAVARRSGTTSVALIMIAFTLLLALGRHTPLYRLLYDHLPMYASFRGTVKFAYLAVPFIALLAGMGFDALRERRATPRLMIGITMGGCAAALVAAVLIGRSGAAGADGAWARSLQRFATEYGQAGEIFVRPRPEAYADDEFIRASARMAAESLYLASIVGGMIVLVLLVRRFRPLAVYGLVVLAALEMFVFARSTRATMTPQLGLPDAPVYDAWRDALRELPRDQRVLIVSPRFANLGMTMNFDGLWGYDPLVLRRYAELLAATQGQDPDRATQYLAFGRVSSGVFRALRCGLVLVPDARQPVFELPDPLPVVTLVGHWIVLPERDSIFRYMLRDEFDPRRGVVLEAEPGIVSGEANVEGATVEVIGSGTDHLDVRIELPRDAMLLITNNYTRGWRARPLAPSPIQPRYEIVPASYVQQAIAVQAGRHLIRIEYAPLEFRVGAWVSSASLVGFSAVIVLMFARSRRSGRTTQPG